MEHKNEKYVTVCIIILALAVESTKVEEHTKNSPLPSSKRSNNQLLPLSSSSRNQQYVLVCAPATSMYGIMAPAAGTPAGTIIPGTGTYQQYGGTLGGTRYGTTK